MPIKTAFLVVGSQANKGGRLTFRIPVDADGPEQASEIVTRQAKSQGVEDVKIDHVLIHRTEVEAILQNARNWLQRGPRSLDERYAYMEAIDDTLYSVGRYDIVNECKLVSRLEEVLLP